MTFVVSANTGGFERAPAGQYSSVCTQIIDLGLQEGYQQQLTRKVMVTFELEEKMSDGRPYVASQWLTLSLHPKSNMSKMINSWRGKAFTPKELKGFDLKKLVGAPALVQIVEDVNADGREISYIGSVTTLPKTMKKVKPHGDTICFNLDEFDGDEFNKLSERMAERVSEGQERLNREKSDEKVNSSPKPVVLDDDIPF